MRMKRLLNVLECEAKKSMESNDCEGIFYVTVLKLLQRDFGNPVLMLHLKTKSIFRPASNKTQLQNWIKKLSP